MTRVQHFETLADHGQLKGKAFKMKTLSPRRLKGLVSLAGTAFAYTHLIQLQLLLGPTVPLAGIAGALFYGITSFSERNVISAIEPLNEGEFAGKVRVTILESPFVTRSFVVDPRNTRSVVSLGADDMGEEDTDGNIVEFDSAIDEATGQAIEGGVYTLPADAYRDLRFMEWFLAPKSEGSETDDLFHSLVASNFEALASTGGLTGLSALNARSTAFANVNLADEADKRIESNEIITEENLRAMREHYGPQRLETMSATELYRLYRDFTSHRQ